MAAMAIVLGVRLRKPGVYVLHAAGRAPGAQEVRRSAVIGGRSVLLGALLATAALVVAAR